MSEKLPHWQALNGSAVVSDAIRFAKELFFNSFLGVAFLSWSQQHVGEDACGVSVMIPKYGEKSVYHASYMELPGIEPVLPW